jgi:hypothetical protein
MPTAHRGDHDIAFYEAAIEETVELDVSTTWAELADSVGPLRSGRWLVQFIGTLEGENLCWLHVGRWTKGEPLGAQAAEPGPRRFPLSEVARAIEFHVVPGYNNRLGAIMESGSGKLLISRISTESKG